METAKEIIPPMTPNLLPVAPPPSDFNRLLILKFVLDEKGVSRAAEKLGVSQSAVSHALGKLREELGDPLFVRKGSAMVPTTRAEEVVATVRRMADELATLFRSETRFSPADYAGTLTLAFSNLAPGSLAGKIVDRLRRAAPNARLLVRRASSADVGELLGDGTVDLAIGRFCLSSANVLRRKLLTDRPMCVARQGHDVLQHSAELDAHTYFDLEHVDALDAEATDASPIAPELQARAMQRRVRMTVPDVSWALEVASSTDLATTVPHSTAIDALSRFNLRMFELPFETSLRSIDELWHERRNMDPLNVWLRSIVRAATTNLEVAADPSDSDAASAA